jgi:hypothetical protein
MADKPDRVDLDQLWKKLGLSLDSGSVVMNDKAPEANIRKSITSARHEITSAAHQHVVSRK